MNRNIFSILGNNPVGWAFARMFFGNKNEVNIISLEKIKELKTDYLVVADKKVSLHTLLTIEIESKTTFPILYLITGKNSDFPKVKGISVMELPIRIVNIPRALSGAKRGKQEIEKDTLYKKNYWYYLCEVRSALIYHG
ncbi:hypothetical protein KAW65_00385 [candidate division WOR-3 bacterium]|nr:hypothetical protein [candidate division WOR-3 bacterium]